VQNDGDVKIVVSDTFDDIVLDETKDVLLEVRFCLVYQTLMSKHSLFIDPAATGPVKLVRGLRTAAPSS
jgi:hypothetical protein